jgi:ATP-grasp domain, R2K clade family 3
MQLLYDPRDDRYHERLGSQILYWLDDLGAIPLDEADSGVEGFLFAGARPIQDYRELVANYPLVRDRPEEREPLLRLDSVLQALTSARVSVPSPRTWVLPLDAPLPGDLTFPLFVRTAESSWKRGGKISRVTTPKGLLAEAAELRRALGWDAMILAREWLELAPAGEGRYGPVPQEVRVWIVDGEPFAWSYHYMQMVPKPTGFPLSDNDRAELRRLGGAVGSAFSSRLVAADFARGQDGRWWFIEAGPGSCAGTGHEEVFKAVARRLRREEVVLQSGELGGPVKVMT